MGCGGGGLVEVFAAWVTEIWGFRRVGRNGKEDDPRVTALLLWLWPMGGWVVLFFKLWVRT